MFAVSMGWTTDVQAQADGCTVLIAGKNTTADRSILFAKTEDDGGKELDYLWYVPRRTHPPGSVIQLRAGGSIQQVPETCAYFWDQCPGTAFSNGVVNEWGVAFGSNGCQSREDPEDIVAARGDLKEGGIGFRLRFILAERSRTAREAVELAARLLDEYGYSASGRNLNIVGPNEAWQLQMARGKQYVARRVQDDEVAIIANTFSIREVDTADPENFICSPRLIDYAVERGWYDPDSGEPFDFAKAYAPERVHTSPSNTRRQWDMARLVNVNFPITWKEAETGVMPVSVKPNRKLTVQDIFAIFRSHFEGTDLDMSDGYQTSPHRTHATICNLTTHRTTVIQQRSWMPPAVGTVIWRALDQPCSSVFIPWYLGAVQIPDALHKAPEDLLTAERDLLDFHFNPPDRIWDLDLDSAPCVFALLGEIVNAHYGAVIGNVRQTWSALEDNVLAMQPLVEETALNLMERNPALASEYLSAYSGMQSDTALSTAWDLINAVKRHTWGVRNPTVIPSHRNSTEGTAEKINGHPQSGWL